MCAGGHVGFQKEHLPAAQNQHLRNAKDNTLKVLKEQKWLRCKKRTCSKKDKGNKKKQMEIICAKMVTKA